MSFTEKIKGRASAWLLVRPSHAAVNRASLGMVLAVCFALVLAMIGLSIGQWSLSEHIQQAQFKRAVKMSNDAAVALNAAMVFGNAHRATLNALVARDTQEWEDSIQRRRTGLANYRAYLEQFKVASTEEEKKYCAEAEQLAEEYARLSQKLLDMAQGGQLEQALDFRLQAVRPVLEKWQVAQDKFSSKHADQTLHENTAQEKTIRTLRGVFFLLVACPVFLLFLGGIAIATLLGWEYFFGKTNKTRDLWVH